MKKENGYEYYSEGVYLTMPISKYYEFFNNETEKEKELIIKHKIERRKRIIDELY